MKKKIKKKVVNFEKEKGKRNKKSVADKLCDRMCKPKTNRTIKESKSSKNKSTKENKNNKDLLKDETSLVKVEEENNENTMSKNDRIEMEYILNDQEIFYGISELTNLIYSSKEATESDMELGKEAFDKTKEIYTDAALHFPKSFSKIVSKGLDMVQKNAVPLTILLEIVKKILSMENKMLKCSIVPTEIKDTKTGEKKEDGVKFDVHAVNKNEDGDKKELTGANKIFSILLYHCNE